MMHLFTHAALCWNLCKYKYDKKSTNVCITRCFSDVHKKFFSQNLLHPAVFWRSGLSGKVNVSPAKLQSTAQYTRYFCDSLSREQLQPYWYRNKEISINKIFSSLNTVWNGMKNAQKTFSYICFFILRIIYLHIRNDKKFIRKYK